MQDLEIINRNNAKAVEDYALKEAAASGKFVLIKYTGLNFHSHELFDTEGARNQAAIDWTNASPGNRSGHVNPAK